MVDYPNHKVTVKGKKADPLRVLERVQNKFSRNAELISPMPKPENKQKKEPEKKEAVCSLFKRYSNPSGLNYGEKHSFFYTDIY